MKNYSYKNKEWLTNQYHIEKLSFSQIGKICNISQGTIYYWMKKLGIFSRTISEANKGRVFSKEWKLNMWKARDLKYKRENSLHRNKEWLYKMYWKEKKSMYQIADICKVCAGCIHYWMKQFNIPRRRLIGKYKKCLTCGEKFYVSKWNKEKKFCSRDCAIISIKGKPNFKKRNGKNIKCAYCGKLFYVCKSQLGRRKCCSKKCRRLDMLKGIYKNCLICGKRFYTSLSNKDKKYCSNKCKGIAKIGKHRSEITKKRIGNAQRGEKNHNWNGGTGKDPYSFDFDKKLKTKIKKRDNYTCQLCGTTEKKKLSVHHIDYNKKNSSEDNLITLCNSCNAKVNFKRVFWSGFFMGIIYKKIRSL